MKSWTPKPEMYDVGRPFPAPHIETLFKDLDTLLDRYGKSRLVFEPGCGTGRILIPIARAHPQHNFLGIDSSPGCLEVLRNRLCAEELSNVTAHVASIPAGIPEGPFDLIILNRAVAGL